MKKLVIALLLVFTIVLTSCGSSSGDNLSKQRLDINIYDETFAEELGLEDLTVALNPLTEEEVDKKKGSYYQVLLASDIKASMVVANFSLDSQFSKAGVKNKAINFQTQAFRNDIYNSEKEQLVKILFSDDYALNDENLAALNLGFDLSKNAHWNKSFESNETTSVSLALDAYKAGEDNLNFSVVYLPVNIERFNQYARCLDAYVLVPVYWSITVYENGVYKDLVKATEGYTLEESVLNNYRTVELQYEKNGCLLNKSEETAE